MKRAFDILFAVCFLVVFSPVYILTWIIIKIVSPGPAIYKAKRVGNHDGNGHGRGNHAGKNNRDGGKRQYDQTALSASRG